MSRQLKFALYDMTDNSLMEMMARGDTEAFKEFVNRYHDGLVLFATRILSGDKAKAEDMIQEVWIKIVKYAPRYDASRPLKPWLLTVTRNRCLSEVTRLKKATKISIEEKSQKDFSTTVERSQKDKYELLLADEALIQETSRQKIRQALDLLPSIQKIALLAWLEEDDYVSVLTRELKTTAGAVHQIVYRAKKNLKDALSLEKTAFLAVS